MKNGAKTVFHVVVPKFIFPGFYNTDFDYDHVLEQNEDDNDYIEPYEYYQDRVVNNIVNHYQAVLPKGFKIVKYELVSPKEYNYRTDEIYLDIACTYEDILYHFFSFEEDNLIDYLELGEYYEYQYHEAMLEVLLEFWPFTGKFSDLFEDTLHEKFIYD